MSSDRSDELTKLLSEASSGRREALESVFPFVYEELKRLARVQLYRGTSETLRTTALVHEVYVKLVDHSRCDWKDRAHFFGVAARAMRSVLVDYARARRAQKRGGGMERVALEEALVGLEERSIDVLALDEALEQLSKDRPRKGQVVALKFFAGLGVKEIAEVLQVSDATVEKDWQFAKAWLFRELSDS